VPLDDFANASNTFYTSLKPPSCASCPTATALYVLSPLIGDNWLLQLGLLKFAAPLFGARVKLAEANVTSQNLLAASDFSEHG
jgi:hypothetical protein